MYQPLSSAAPETGAEVAVALRAVTKVYRSRGGAVAALRERDPVPRAGSPVLPALLGLRRAVSVVDAGHAAKALHHRVGPGRLHAEPFAGGRGAGDLGLPREPQMGLTLAWLHWPVCCR